MGRHRRNIPAPNPGEAGLSRDSRKLARQVLHVLGGAGSDKWTGNFLIGFLTPFANDGISYAFGFVFCGCNLAAALIVYLFMYETKLLSLESVNVMYQEPRLRAWTSSKWTPPGYVDRKTRDDAYWERRESVVVRSGSMAPAARGVGAREDEKYDSSSDGKMA